MRRNWLALVLLLTATGCARDIDLTPPEKPKPGGPEKPEPVPPENACSVDGGLCATPSPTCARDKEACAVPADCCSGRCEIKAAEPGKCKLLPGCHVSYETC